MSAAWTCALRRLSEAVSKGIDYALAGLTSRGQLTGSTNSFVVGSLWHDGRQLRGCRC
jgi:hypothetical protein